LIKTVGSKSGIDLIDLDISVARLIVLLAKFW
jgi:hypothetical protein